MEQHLTHFIAQCQENAGTEDAENQAVFNGIFNSYGDSCSVLADCASETVGSSKVEADAVIADGNKMSGMDIPVRTPYVLSEVETSMPYTLSRRGIKGLPYFAGDLRVRGLK